LVLKRRHSLERLEYQTAVSGVKWTFHALDISFKYTWIRPLLPPERKLSAQVSLCFYRPKSSDLAGFWNTPSTVISTRNPPFYICILLCTKKSDNIYCSLVSRHMIFAEHFLRRRRNEGHENNCALATRLFGVVTLMDLFFFPQTGLTSCLFFRSGFCDTTWCTLFWRGADSPAQ
jgi:hypothetical protein